MWNMTLKEIRDQVESQVTVFDLTAFLASVALCCYILLRWEQRKNRKDGE